MATAQTAAQIAVVKIKLSNFCVALILL